ncbi:ribonuclease P protein component [Coriobacterium glomerans PW2]|uniref:Ribonuclease P protein component n=1 Tax=Coriobacterium glomerans (strain ATCC 49209 / DSM 20642 / JCM 10262 / PW2) TaxID=700015 RepID=F2N9F0_CORGP|nr:ribonuclease P protein component [Coriobacterium glomerans]AEB07898.1 ribonuclease P protein component [Coriobacterium glomerans PW2]
MRTIASHSDFERVFSRGYRLNHPLMRMVICRLDDEGAPGRVAFAAAKRLGCAPRRNRAKRVMRACARNLGFPVQGFDVILFATRATGSASQADLTSALTSLCGRAGMHAH